MSVVFIVLLDIYTRTATIPIISDTSEREMPKTLTSEGGGPIPTDTVETNVNTKSNNKTGTEAHTCTIKVRTQASLGAYAKICCAAIENGKHALACAKRKEEPSDDRFLVLLKSVEDLTNYMNQVQVLELNQNGHMAEIYQKGTEHYERKRKKAECNKNGGNKEEKSSDLGGSTVQAASGDLGNDGAANSSADIRVAEIAALLNSAEHENEKLKNQLQEQEDSIPKDLASILEKERSRSAGIQKDLNDQLEKQKKDLNDQLEKQKKEITEREIKNTLSRKKEKEDRDKDESNRKKKLEAELEKEKKKNNNTKFQLDQLRSKGKKQKKNDAAIIAKERENFRKQISQMKKTAAAAKDKSDTLEKDIEEKLRKQIETKNKKDQLEKNKKHANEKKAHLKQLEDLRAQLKAESEKNKKDESSKNGNDDGDGSKNDSDGDGSKNDSDGDGSKNDPDGDGSKNDNADTSSKKQGSKKEAAADSTKEVESKKTPAQMNHEELFTVLSMHLNDKKEGDEHVMENSLKLIVTSLQVLTEKTGGQSDWVAAVRDVCTYLNPFQKEVMKKNLELLGEALENYKETRAEMNIDNSAGSLFKYYNTVKDLSEETVKSSVFQALMIELWIRCGRSRSPRRFNMLTYVTVYVVNLVAGNLTIACHKDRTNVILIAKTETETYESKNNDTLITFHGDLLEFMTKERKKMKTKQKKVRKEEYNRMVKSVIKLLGAEIGTVGWNLFLYPNTSCY